jgi:hypothetical protein
MFGNILGRAGGGAPGGDKNTLAQVNVSIFKEVDAAVDFANQLLPRAGDTMVMQPQGEDVSPLPQGGANITFMVPPLGGAQPPQQAGGGQPPPPPPQQTGRGGSRGQQLATGNKAYSGIVSVLRKLGHTMYDQGTINLELTAQIGINPGGVTSCRSFRYFIVHVH